MWIKTLGPQDDPTVKAIHDQLVERRGFMASILRAFTLKPALLEQMKSLTEVVTFGASSLGRKREELISAYVSNLLKCHY